MELTRDCLYQVKHWDKGWIIARYRSFIDTHIAKGYRGSDGATSWKEPATHYWEYMWGGTFSIRAKGMETRSVAEETLVEIARLQTEMERLKQERIAVFKQLKDLCS